MLAELFTSHDRPALVDGASGVTLSFAELARAVAQGADDGGPWSGGLAFVYTRNRPADVVAELALQRAGLAVALVDATLAVERRAQLESLYQPDVVVGLPAAEPERRRRVPLGGTCDMWVVRGARPPAVLPGTGLCLSTSGSTGSPKFVRLTNAAVEANARSIAAALSISADEVALAHLPVHYSYGLSVVHSHLVAGSTVVLSADSALRRSFFETVRRWSVTTIPNVPFGFQLLDRVGFLDLDLPTVRTLTQAGGRLSLDVADRYHAAMADRGGNLHIMYGQTEATARMSVLPGERYRELRGSVGRAIPGGSFEVVGPDPDGLGEVRYHGPNVMLGYAFERAGLARPDELGGVLDTGDSGSLDGDVLTVSGRIGRVAKVYGLRFELDEVERLAGGRAPSAAIEADDRLVVFAEALSTDACSALARELCRSLRLPPAGVDVRAVDALPRTSAGKVAYADLRSLVTS